MVTNRLNVEHLNGKDESRPPVKGSTQSSESQKDKMDNGLRVRLTTGTLGTLQGPKILSSWFRKICEYLGMVSPLVSKRNCPTLPFITTLLIQLLDFIGDRRVTLHIWIGLYYKGSLPPIL